jgi:hypothetical protein
MQIVDCRQLVSGGEQFDGGGTTAASRRNPFSLAPEIQF